MKKISLFVLSLALVIVVSSPALADTATTSTSTPKTEIKATQGAIIKQANLVYAAAIKKINADYKAAATAASKAYTASLKAAKTKADRQAALKIEKAALTAAQTARDKALKAALATLKAAKTVAPVKAASAALVWDASAKKILSNYASFDYSSVIRNAYIKKVEAYARRNNIKVITAAVVNGMHE